MRVLCTKLLWTLCIFCTDVLWAVCVLCTGLLWTLCIFCTDVLWAVCVLCTDLLWTMHALYDSLWTLPMLHYGSLVDTVYTPECITLSSHVILFKFTNSWVI